MSNQNKNTMDSLHQALLISVIITVSGVLFIIFIDLADSSNETPETGNRFLRVESGDFDGGLDYRIYLDMETGVRYLVIDNGHRKFGIMRLKPEYDSPVNIHPRRNQGSIRDPPSEI